MPFSLIRGDITKIQCDAVVNAANSTLLGGGGVDGAIHIAAGPLLLNECRTLGGCDTGKAKITGGYKMPCKYIIHTVGPVWQGGLDGEDRLLRDCYRNSLKLASEYNCKSVAFPLISSGAYGYPKQAALNIAVDEISSFVLENDILVYLVVFDSSSFCISGKLFNDIRSYIDDNYAEEKLAGEGISLDLPSLNRTPGTVCSIFDSASKKFNNTEKENGFFGHVPYLSESFAPLDEQLKNLDESFSQMLLRKIDEKGMTDSECYKKANIDRKLFSKIRNDINYRPKKTTVISFCIALCLTSDETEEMLNKAGYTLSRSSKFDIIIDYFIKNGNYNIFEINEALFAFDQVLLGA